MELTDSADLITYGDLRKHVLSYESHVPPKLQELETFRLKEIPATLMRRDSDGGAFLEKEEVTKLVEWKLKHGTYRPNLAKLVASNSAKDIRETTKSAFAIYKADNGKLSEAIKTLTKLKGIGPATATLLLSTYDPDSVPFFSDELYRYLHFETGKGKGWDRKIKYTMKEYDELFSRKHTLLCRLEREGKVTAIDIEKLAYVLAKEATSSTNPPTKRVNPEPLEDIPPPPPPPKRSKKDNGIAPRTDPLSSLKEDLRREAEVRRKGLNGTHTYDTLGYELDKEYIIKKTSNRPPSARSAWGPRAMAKFAQERKNTERKAEILGIKKPSNDISPLDEMVWDDRVARDLGKAYHEVGMEEYEEWRGKGCRIEEGELELGNLTEEEKKRISRVATGSALRKGSKHR